MAFSVVLLDLDGTLINTNDLIVTSFQHTFREQLGLEVPTETIFQYFGEPLPTTMARYSQERALELTDFYRAFNSANHDMLVKQFEGMQQALGAMLAARVKLGVVTSKRTDLALRGLRVCGMEPYFGTVVGMDQTEKHKPEPDPIYRALDQLGAVPGDHVLMVGDSTFDILCGRNAGVKTAAVGWTVIERELLTRISPDYWVEEPSELATLVLER
jgi:pyrophosphatase PpaX